MRALNSELQYRGKLYPIHCHNADAVESGGGSMKMTGSDVVGVDKWDMAIDTASALSLGMSLGI